MQSQGGNPNISQLKIFIGFENTILRNRKKYRYTIANALIM